MISHGDSKPITGTPSPPLGQPVQDAVALGIEIPDKEWNSATSRALVAWQGAYSLAGLVAGLTVMCFGAWLVTQQLSSGQTDWSVEAAGFHFKLSTTVPGIVVAIVGLGTVIVTRFKVKAVRDGVGKI